MKRIFTGLLVAAAIGIAVAACDSGDDDYAGAYGGSYTDCGQATTCGTCTPINGCGWCFDSDGTGACTSGPDQCATPEFSWTWDPNGCRETADAGVVETPDTGATPDSAPMAVDGAGDDAATDGAAESSATP